jgi:hypothetical protein
MKDSVPLAPLQKYARFILIVFAVAMALYLMAVPFFAWHRHMTLAAAALPAFGMFGVFGLWGIGDHICDRRKLDELEALIYQRAITLGMQIFWLVFVLSCMGVWAVLSFGYHQTKAPVDFLPFLVMLGWIVFMVSQSIAILVQYKRSLCDEAR